MSYIAQSPQFGNSAQSQGQNQYLEVDTATEKNVASKRAFEKSYDL
jgi:hypothetical protein